MIKIYTAALYNLRMCMKEDNPGLNNSREIISSVTKIILFVLSLKVLVLDLNKKG